MDFGSYFTTQYLMSFVTVANITGVIGGMLYIASISMKTVIPLRIAAIASAFFFLCSAIFAHSLPAMFMYALLLPLNVVRLYQMLELIKKVRAAAGSDLSMDWLEPFMTKRKYRQGDFLFRKDDPAGEMFLAVKGKYLVPEMGKTFGPGEIFGELGLLTSQHHRTQSVQCVESGHVLTITLRQGPRALFREPRIRVLLPSPHQ